MYRRPKFLELLVEIREQMSRDADYDVDLFAELVRSGKISAETGRDPAAPVRNGDDEDEPDHR